MMLSEIRKKLIIEHLIANRKNDQDSDGLFLQLFKFFHKKEVERLKKKVGDDAAKFLEESEENVYWDDIYLICRKHMNPEDFYDLSPEIFLRESLYEYIKFSCYLPDLLKDVFYLKIENETDPNGNVYKVIDLTVFTDKRWFLNHFIHEAINLYDNYDLIKEFLGDDYEPYNTLIQLRSEIFPYKERI